MKGSLSLSKNGLAKNFTQIITELGQLFLVDLLISFTPSGPKEKKGKKCSLQFNTIHIDCQ